jgi:hypothetical protein
MTDLQQAARTGHRPVTVTVAAVLTAVVAVLHVAQVLFWLPFEPWLGMTASLLVGALATATCWAVTVPGLLRARSWAQVAVTALAAVGVAQGLPGVLNALGHTPDPVLLGYSAALTTPLAVIALLWTPGARAWFGPVR